MKLGKRIYQRCGSDRMAHLLTDELLCIYSIHGEQVKDKGHSKGQQEQGLDKGWKGGSVCDCST